jgi:uncharacterized membrane protein HdeD (DUF308 family)
MAEIDVRNPKRGKNMLIGGWLTALVGLILCFNDSVAIGTLAILLGLTLVIVGRITHWYYWK